MLRESSLRVHLGVFFFALWKEPPVAAVTDGAEARTHSLVQESAAACRRRQISKALKCR